MVNFVSVKELRPGLPKVIKNIDSRMQRYVVTNRGKPVAVMMSPEDYEGLLETIEILSDKEAVSRIKMAKRQIRQGKVISSEELRRRIEK